MGLLDRLARLFERAPQSPAPAISPFAPGSGPARLVVLRHAEKSGDKRDPHLSLEGRRRAERLVDYIPRTFGSPEFLIAARTSERSRRPVETLEPLAAALKLDILAKFDDHQSRAVLRTLDGKQRHRGTFGVICWRHSQLPRLLEVLGAAKESYPHAWDETDYTTIIDLTYPGDGQALTRRLQMPF